MKIAFATALLAASAAPAVAETVFVGNATITARTTACGASATVGDFGRLTYRPAATGFGNDADSYLAYVTSRASFAMIVPNNTFRASVNYSGQSLGSTLSIATKVGGITEWSQAPATLATNTRTINLTATLANFWTITGCTVSLRANLLLVPN